jgi:spermidine/putrescine transport system substrate-binding protein
LANGDDPARPTVAQAETAYLQLEAANDQGQFHSWVFNEFTDLLKGGQVAASMAWSGDAVQLQLDRPDIKFVIPDEGAIQWFDTMVIPTGANNAKGAAEWMNTFYDPVLAAANTQWVQYISPVLGVEDELRSLGGPAAELANNPVLFPDDETRRRLFIWGGLDSTGDEQDLDDRFAGFLPAT